MPKNNKAMKILSDAKEVTDSIDKYVDGKPNKVCIEYLEHIADHVDSYLSSFDRNKHE
jgi:hypothetical protein